MKKILVIFALFCALFLISCGSDEEDVAGQQSGTSDTVTDNESEFPDSSSQDTEETASDDDTDTAEPQRNEGELYGECYPNKTCNDGLVCDTENNICIKDDSAGKDDSDNGDSTGDKDSGDSLPDEDNGAETESESKKCLDAGGKWEMSAGGNSCTKTTKCDKIPATVAHAEWNGSDSYTQTYTDGAWSKKILTEYSETAGECKYKCDPAYAYEGNNCINQKTVDCADKPANSVWNGASSYSRIYANGAWSAEIPTEYSTVAGICKYKCDDTHYWYNLECINPCDYEPCEADANATLNSCVASSWQDYSCGCKEGYVWHQTQCKKPLTLGNICTGQTKCYNYSNQMTCPTSSSDNFYGQDAQFTDKCTPQSFTPGTGTLAGTVFDNNTFLTWEQSPSTNTYTWENAHEHCDDLNTLNDDEGFAGIKTWRVPNPLELQTIVDNSTYNPATNSNFTNMPTSDSMYLWTNQEGSQSYAYYFSPSYGWHDRVEKTSTYKVLCVSGNELLPTSSSDFTISGPSGSRVVIDNKTGLIWPISYQTNKTWQEALAYCQSIYGRLPNKNELASLLAIKASSSTNSNFPLEIPGSTFWSSSTYAGNSNLAWVVNFYQGGNHKELRKTSNQANVRCVWDSAK